MNTKNFLSTALPVLAILATATPTFAASPAGNSTVVRYSDLNLATEDGQATLNRRIAHAAEKVCWQADGPTLYGPRAVRGLPFRRARKRAAQAERRHSLRAFGSSLRGEWRRHCDARPLTPSSVRAI
jgi:UrcA family protein